MMRRVGVVMAWIAATVLSTVIAASAVGSLRGQVTDLPAIAATTPAAFSPTTTSESTNQVPTSTVESTTTTVAAVPAETSTTAAPSSTTVAAATTEPLPTTVATTTLAPAPSTTTTTTTTTTTSPPSKEITRTYQLDGGQVSISAVHPTVSLVSAVPNPGYAAEVEDGGPEQVRVEFESATIKWEFRATWQDGVLDVEITSEAEDDD